KPTPIEVKQPDGTTITVILKGDERIKWAETIDGYSLLKNGDGVFEYAIQNEKGDMIASGIKATNGAKASPTQQKHLRFSRAQKEDAFASPNSPKPIAGVNLAKKRKTKDITHRMPVIIVSFKNRACTFSKDDFDTIFNTRGLNKPPYTGSIADYFYDNSRGTFEFTADVFGPYTLSKDMSYYGGNDSYGNDKNPRAMVREAVNLANDSGCDFSQYDADGDGFVDGIHIIFAGEGEESTSESSAIWSHEWELYPVVTLGGKKIRVYSCSPELNGPGVLTGIGAPAHEIGHAIGLPDFYDTDYTDGGGEAVTPAQYDVMDVGSYNGDGYTPPLHNAWSRMCLGWLERKSLTKAATVNLPPAAEATKCYVIETKTEHEYFVLDNRPVSKWDIWEDVYVGAGLLIFAIDSNNGHWDDNCLNCNPSSRGFYIKQANGGNKSTSRMGNGTPFPGSTNNISFTDSTSPNSVSKAGAATEKPITNIHIDADKHVLFDFMNGGDPEPPMAMEGKRVSSGITVFPNPAKSHITVKSDNAVLGMEMFDFVGKRIVVTAGNELSLQNVPEGIYFLKIKTVIGTVTEKVVVKR
ncbi:MAG: M6 family metalloprotease domain-containing protein, partial [Bacteroidales bacterium]|nr:M6 family metalloprotease domain-containing protein [Bacteroidales bacterium]